MYADSGLQAAGAGGCGCCTACQACDPPTRRASHFRLKHDNNDDDDDDSNSENKVEENSQTEKCTLRWLFLLSLSTSPRFVIHAGIVAPRPLPPASTSPPRGALRNRRRRGREKTYVESTSMLVSCVPGRCLYVRTQAVPICERANAREHAVSVRVR